MIKGRGLLNKVINRLPIEFHLPGYQYCGPGTKLKERVARGDPGINPLDAACKEHDIAYSQNRENIEERNKADKILADKAWHRVLAKDSRATEKVAAYAITNVMNLKAKLGMGLKKRATRRRAKPEISLSKIIKAASKSAGSTTPEIIRSALKNARTAVKMAGGRKNIRVPRILPLPKKVGGFLPLLIPLFAGLSATGALAGGAAGIVKAVNNSKAATQQLLESQRHNKTIEAIALGKGLYLKPHKTGFGLQLKTCEKKNFKVRLPKRALTDADLLKYSSKIPNFRGVFMRNDLPPGGPHYREAGIINLDNKDGPGTHWVAYRKNSHNVDYFDSFGDLQPPRDLIDYLGPDNVIKYNHERYQNFDTYECGHLCLKFLYKCL